jgi:pyruvate/2-oxoglutarate dehydrogenase complex dihydrolipoamide dehydrogenase (E3) component/uncharacterized membrane protein YdjX (TVP38/TMEM64 family)
MKPKILQKFFLLLVIAGLLFFGFKYSSLLSLESFQSYRADLEQFTSNNFTLALILFFTTYVVSTAVSLPGATVLTLAGGALFGLYYGLIVVSFASTLGATISFLLSRFLFRDWIRGRFQSVFKKIDEGFTNQGGSYLFSMRLLPIFPFFAVNALMGLTKISTFRFFVISQIGMLPGTILYVWAGTELGQVTTLAGLISAKILVAFAALALFPYLVKFLLKSYKRHRMYSRFQKPAKFDYNLVVIGAGAAGLVSTAIARAVKAKTAIIESHKMGGDCLNYGCVPSKALIHASHMFNRKIEGSGPLSDSDFSIVRAHIQSSIDAIAPHDSVERFTGLGADVFKGQAKIVSPWEVEINGSILKTKSIIIASGAAPVVPKILGIENVQALTSESIWDLNQLPKRLIILGGGPIGCEISQALSKLGTDVILVERANRLLSGEVSAASDIILQKLSQDGVKVLLNSEVQSFPSASECLIKLSDGTIITESMNAVFFAIGRKPRIENLGLEKLGIAIAKNGTVEHNSLLQTNFENIYVCGDVAGPIQLTHVAGHQAWYAAVNALFSTFKTYSQDLRVIPRCTFTMPEVASVGATEQALTEMKQDFEVTHYPLTTFDRAVCDGATEGFVRILTEKKSDQILGVTIVAPRAGEMIAEFSLAMRWRLGLKKILATVHAYPTWSDANKMAALAWQKKHVPHKIVALSEKFHDWKRT